MCDGISSQEPDGPTLWLSAMGKASLWMTVSNQLSLVFSRAGEHSGHLGCLPVPAPAGTDALLVQPPSKV